MNISFFLQPKSKVAYIYNSEDSKTENCEKEPANNS